MPAMLTSKFTTDILLLVFITSISTSKFVRCQFSGRSFDSSRYRQQIPEDNRSYPRWNSRSNSRRAETINNRQSSNLRGHLNNQDRFQNDQFFRGHVQYNTLDNNPRAQSEQNTQSSFTGNDRSFRPRFPNSANMQTERFQESSRGAVFTRGSSRNKIGRALPLRRQTVSRRRQNSRNVRIDMPHGRSRNNNRPSLQSLPAPRIPHRQPYRTPVKSQLLSRPMVSRIYPDMTPTRDRSNQNQASRPRIRAERNEVFQYRTSVRRTPQSSESSSNNGQERFTGYPAQSLSLPFEPLSLRYRGYRDSKVAEQQQIQPDGIRNVKDLGQNDPRFGQRQAGVAADIETANRDTSFQPRTPVLYRRNIPSFGIDRVVQPNTMRSRFVQGRDAAGQNTNTRGRNVATRTRRLMMPLNRGRMFQTSTRANDRLVRPNNFNGNTLPRSRVQDRFGRRSRRPFNRHRNTPNVGLWNRRREHVPTGPLHELFGISRTGLENAIKSDAQQAERTTSRNRGPGKSSASKENRYRWQVQRAVDNRVTQNKDNLIADITKSLELADKLDLMGMHQIDSQTSSRITPHINYGSLKQLIKLPDGFLPFTNILRSQNTDLDDD